MAKREITIYDKIETELYKPTAEVKYILTPTEIEVKKRILLCVTKLVDNPLMLNSELLKFLQEGCEGSFTKVSQSQAYNDIIGINKIVGNIRLASKAWYRYMVVEGCKNGYQIAVKNDDPQGIAANMDKIGKYTRADKEDDGFDWSQMIPPNMEPTDDVSVLEGFEPIANLEEERKAFKLLFKKQLNKKAVDTEIDE